MKIKIFDGCTTSNIFVDDVSIENIDEVELFDKLSPKIREHLKMGCIRIKDIIELFQYESYEEFSRCEQCGDIPYVVTYDI